MINRLTQLLKDPAKLSVTLGVIFLLGIVLSAITLYSLPGDLVFKGGMTTQGIATKVFAKLFIIVGLTFLVGAWAINTSLKIKKEIIVFKEKSANASAENADTASHATTIDTHKFNTAIKEATRATVAQVGLNTICQLMQAGQGAFYTIGNKGDKKTAQLKSGFALSLSESESISFEMGEGLVGQAALSGKSIYLDELPEGYSSAIVSGLGMAPPKFLFVAALKKENEVKGVIELATFKALSESARKQVEEMAANMIEKI